MIKQNSKIFLLITALITLVMVISFGVLYFVMPDFYLYTKNKKLQSESEALAKALGQSSSYETCSDLIQDFSLKNNSNVIPYDQNGMIIAVLSSPLIMLSTNERIHLKIEEVPRQQTIRIQQTPSDLKFVITGEMQSAPSSARSSSLQSVRLAGSTGNSSLIKVNVQGDIISHIEVMSTFQPIDEAKSVLLSLMPFLLIIDILIALTAAYLYLKKVSQYERDKVDFMRAASHELKTPVAALGGMIEGMIDHVGVYKNTAKYLNESKKLVDRLGVLINEILSASQSEKLALEDVSIGNILDDALLSYKLFIEEKSLQVSIETLASSSPLLPPPTYSPFSSFSSSLSPSFGGSRFDFTCKADKKLFFLVISNLISNAVHYTKQGGVVKIRVVKHQCLSIENECDPVTEEQLSKLFDPFYTLNDSRDKSQSGTGLGLYIVRRSLDIMKIRYRMENTSLGIKFSIFF